MIIAEEMTRIRTMLSDMYPIYATTIPADIVAHGYTAKEIIDTARQAGLKGAVNAKIEQVIIRDNMLFVVGPVTKVLNRIIACGATPISYATCQHEDRPLNALTVVKLSLDDLAKCRHIMSVEG